jgi:hypothetical protein
MESRFAALQDEPDEPEDDPIAAEPSTVNPLTRLSPHYSIEDVLRAQRSGSQPPPEIQHFENVYIREFQTPESATFRPPTSDINSAASYGTKDKGQQRSYQQPNSRRTASPRTAPPSRAKKAQQRPGDLRDEPEPPGQVWVYRDPFDRLMGPYTSQRMREWLGKRYFDGNLQIAVSENGPFQALGAVFPDQATAFADDGRPPAKAVYAEGFEDRGKERRPDTLVSFLDADDSATSWENFDQSH